MGFTIWYCILSVNWKLHILYIRKMHSKHIQIYIIRPSSGEPLVNIY